MKKDRFACFQTHLCKRFVAFHFRSGNTLGLEQHLVLQLKKKQTDFKHENNKTSSQKTFKPVRAMGAASSGLCQRAWQACRRELFQDDEQCDLAQPGEKK